MEARIIRMKIKRLRRELWNMRIQRLEETIEYISEVIGDWMKSKVITGKTFIIVMVICLLFGMVVC